jgi:hypothetical protein
MSHHKFLMLSNHLTEKEIENHQNHLITVEPSHASEVMKNMKM